MARVQTQRIARFDGGNQIVEVVDETGATVPAPTSTTAGGVKLGVTIAAAAAATATADTASVATDVPGLLADHNDLVTKYNALLADTALIRTALNAVLAQLKAQTIPI
jgi:hypothetical protein